MDLDAISCYNRIMALFGMLCSRYFGMPKAACRTAAFFAGTACVALSTLFYALLSGQLMQQELEVYMIVQNVRRSTKC
jgi:hypothetical protein